MPKFDNPNNTINAGSFNVPDERAQELTNKVGDAYDKLDEYSTYDDWYFAEIVPLSDKDNEQLFLAFMYGKVFQALVDFNHVPKEDNIMQYFSKFFNT